MNTDPALPKDLSIEPASPADAELLCSLIRELAEFENLTAECKVTPEALREHLFGAAPCAAAVIARTEGQAAGFALWYRTFSTFVAKPGVHLEDLFVRPSFRRRGIGRALLREVGRLAHCSDSGRYEWTTLTWNHNARRLYASVGAREMGEWLLLRMDAEALERFACCGEGAVASGAAGHSCRCGGRGRHHQRQGQ